MVTHECKNINIKCDIIYFLYFLMDKKKQSELAPISIIYRSIHSSLNLFAIL